MDLLIRKLRLKSETVPQLFENRKGLESEYLLTLFTHEHEVLMFKKISFFSLSFLIFNTSLAFSVEEPANAPLLYGGINEKQIYSLDNIVESKKASSASIEVITLEEMKEQNFPMLPELLNQLGGVAVQRSGSTGDITSFRIRGTDRVRVTVDGVRADSPVDNKFYLNNYLSDDLERIEVIKGPQGNVAGVNASGGLVSLQTRRGYGKPSVEFESGMGNLGSYRERFAVMGGDEKKDYYLGVNWFKTDGGTRINDWQKVKNDDYNTLNVVSNLGARMLQGRAEVRNITRFSNSRKNVGINGFGPNISQDPNDYSKNMDFLDTIAFNYKPKEWYDSSTKFGVFSTVNNFFQRPDGYDSGYGNDWFRSTRLSFITQHNFKYKNLNTFSTGYNLESNIFSSISDYSSDPFWPSYNKFGGNTLQNDVFVNDVINIKDKLFLRGGTRLTHHSQFGTYVSPNVSAALVLPTYKMAGDYTKFRSSFGQNINTPTLYQMFGRLANMLDPNPNLKPEKLNGWDVGVEQTFFNEKLSADFGYFSSRYKDYIGWQSDPFTWIGSYVNVNEAKINGYEAGLKWQPNYKLKTVLNYTFTDSEDLATGYNLVGVPKNRLNASIFYSPIERLNVFATVESSSSRIYTGNSSVSGYVNASLGTSVRLFNLKKCQIYFKAQAYNLFNQRISMYQNYYQPGIHFMAGLYVKINAFKETL